MVKVTELSFHPLSVDALTGMSVLVGNECLYGSVYQKYSSYSFYTVKCME